MILMVLMRLITKDGHLAIMIIMYTILGREDSSYIGSRGKVFILELELGVELDYQAKVSKIPL